MKTRYIILFLLSFLKGYSQKIIQAQLVDSLSGEAIEFANVGIVGKGIGTVSDEKGEFSFSVPDSLVNERIKISMIGYRARTIPAASFVSGGKILLSQQNTLLNEVTIVPRDVKVKIVGNETRSSFVSGGFMQNSLGAEIAVRLKIKKEATVLRKVMLNINKNSLDTLPIFRFNVYSVNGDGSPGENILKQNIIITPKEIIGFIEFDLKPYGIVVDDDVFIAIEWIKDLGDVKGLYFSTKMVGAGMYYRQASQGNWRNTSSIGIGLHAEIAY